MKNNFVIFSGLTILLLCVWVSYELLLSKEKVQNEEVIEVINPQVNTDVLEGLTSKFYL